MVAHNERFVLFLPRLLMQRLLGPRGTRRGPSPIDRARLGTSLLAQYQAQRDTEYLASDSGDGAGTADTSIGVVVATSFRSFRF